MDTTEGHLFGRWRVIAERPLLVDFLLALVLAAAVFKAALPESTHRPTGWDVLIAVVAFVAVMGRRRRPMTSLAIATTATAVAVVQEVRNPGLIVALGVITYSIAAHTDRRRGWTCAAAASSVVYLTVVLLNRDVWLRPDVLGLFAWVFLAAAVGDAARSHRAYVREVEERARRAEHSRDEEARRRVTEERLRIARELHDVVAHHIAVINVQAGAATHILERRPDQVAPALTHIRDASNNVLSEIQSVVGVLRGADEPADTEPAPGLERLPELLAGLAAAGFTPEYRQVGDPQELPVVADLAAYRIVQEALTNAYKHGAGTARLTVRHNPAAVEIEVVNALPAGAPAPGSGYGLLGMRERAAAAGGMLTAGAAGGAFRVHAVLPSDAPAPPPPSGCGSRPRERSRAFNELHELVTGHLASINSQARAAPVVIEHPGLVTPSLAEVQSVVRLLHRANGSAFGARLLGAVEPAGAESAPAEPVGTEPTSAERPGTEPASAETAGTEPTSSAERGLGRLPDLVAELAATGIVVEHRAEGEPRELPAVADQAAYRIADAAAASAHRAGVRAARLTVRHLPDAVEIEVVSVAGDGFRVHAVVPVGSRASGCGAVPRGRVRPA